MEALGISQHIRSLGDRFQGWVVRPISAGDPPKEMLFPESEEYEVRCVQRKLLLDALAGELPQGTIRFSSKLVHIELSGHYKMVHLSDGTILKTKVLVGCDGVKSVVGKWLGFKNPVKTSRVAIRGIAHFQTGHELGFCNWITSTENRLYIGWFGVLMIPTLLTTTSVFIIAFIAAPPVDIDGIREPVSGNCFPLIFTQKYSNRFQWRVVVKHSDLGLRRRQQQEAAKPVSNSLWVVSLVS
jgi:2-polyprenyl-6-methoxyphenol hydroxylase-like FAD-dependent oxidoreductase